MVGDFDPASLRRHFPGRLIYTLRSSAAGGRGSDRTLVPLPEFDPGGYAAVVHATPARDERVFDVGRLRPGTTVADFVCADAPTALVQAARSGGLRIVDGRDVLLQEATRHFQAMTGHRPPRLSETR